ncbi:hypothetical protein JCM10213v2_008443 [Rhodosporidiobolus nylandii]
MTSHTVVECAIWKTHKHFCKQPAPTAFTFPPLTKDEAAYFSKPISPVTGPFILNMAKKTRMYWDEYAAKREWYPGMEYTGEELLHELQKKEGCEIPEPGRSLIISALFQHIYLINAQPHLPTPPRSQWHMTGQDLLWFTQLAEETGHPMPPDFLERVTPFFQQILIYHTLSLDDRPYADGKQIHLLRVTATKRLLPFVEEGGVNLPKPIRDCLAEVARNCLKGVVRMPMMGLMANMFGEEAVFGGPVNHN